MVPKQRRSVIDEPSVTLDTVATATVSSRILPVQMLLQRGGQALVIILPSLVLLLLAVYPLAAIILQSVFPHIYDIQPTLVPSLDGLTAIFSSNQNYLAFVNSLWLGTITALLACILGTFLAFLSRRTDLPVRHAMDGLIWIIFFMPSFLLGEAWELIIIHGGIPDQFLHFPN